MNYLPVNFDQNEKQNECILMKYTLTDFLLQSFFVYNTNGWK